jgi:hypothetical protein
MGGAPGASGSVFSHCHLSASTPIESTVLVHYHTSDITNIGLIPGPLPRSQLIAS